MENNTFIRLLHGKINSFFYIIREIRGMKGKIKLALAIFLNLLFPTFFRRFSLTLGVMFPIFYLKFRIGRTELTAYQENKNSFCSLFQSLPDKDNWVVIDCGANVGLFSLFLKDAKKIIAVEPNSDCCKRLLYNLNRNKVRASIINKAVSSSEGDVRMTILTNTALSKVSDMGNKVIKATTIDRIITDSVLYSVDLLKLDLEGYELEALFGAKDSLTKRKIKRIFVEFNNNEMLENLDRYLTSFDFKRIATIQWNAFYELQYDLTVGYF